MNGLMKDDVCKFVCVCFVFILYYFFKKRIVFNIFKEYTYMSRCNLGLATAFDKLQNKQK